MYRTQNKNILIPPLVILIILANKLFCPHPLVYFTQLTTGQTSTVHLDVIYESITTYETYPCNRDLGARKVCESRRRTAYGNCCCSCLSRRPSPLDRTRAHWR